MDLNKFGNTITEFRHGTLPYSCSFNSIGNLFFVKNSDQLNQSMIKLDIKNIEYNIDKFSALYNLEFEEFKPVKSSEIDSLSLQSKLKELETKLSASMISATNSTVTSLESDILRLTSDNRANRDVIIQLRMSMGEGLSYDDFSSEFPYLLKTTT